MSGSHTAIEAYTAKSEIRRLTSAIPGDYDALGNSLLVATGYTDQYRNRLYLESSATIATDETGNTGIPSQGLVEAAYLYWTGWIDWHNYDPDSNTIFSDNCSDFGDWNRNYSSRWSIYGYYYSSQFRGQGGGSSTDRTLTMSDSLNLSAYAPGTVAVSWNQTTGGSLESNDYLYYAFSGDGGSHWSANYEAFHDDYPTNPFTVTIPGEYLTSNFKMRFYFTFDSSYEYVYLDNITIRVSGPSLEYPDNPTTANLTTLIENAARTNVVMLDAGGSDAVEVTANRWQIEPTTDSPGDHTYQGTWSYCCFADVTQQLRQWSEDGYVANNAAGTYTLGHKIATNESDPSFSFSLYNPSGPNRSTGYPLGTPAPDYRPDARYNYSHAGWSLVVIYTSPETLGHQLYLFDIQDPDFTFTEAWGPSGTGNPDFDGDGTPGGRVSGFLVPEPIAGESLAAKMTVLVGEGDSTITGDYFRVNGVNRSNSASPANNVWNSAYPGSTTQGVDIDTFTINWNEGILDPGDTEADIDMPTGSDGFNLAYIILSFRSQTITGGTISFLISG